MIKKYVLIFVVFSLTLGICVLFAQEPEATEIITDIENVDTAASSNESAGSTNVVRRIVLDKDFLEAEKQFFDKKYYLARRAFLKYLDENPLSTNDMLYYYLASTYFIDKDYSSAIDYYKIALDLNGTPFYYNNVANSYYQMKSYPEALAWYRRSIDRIENAPQFDIIENIVETNYIQTNYITNIAVLDISLYKSLVNKYSDIESLSKNIDSQQGLTTVGNTSSVIEEVIQNTSSTDSDEQLETDTTEIIDTNTTTTNTPTVNLSSTSDFRDKMETISDILINRIENEMFLSQTNIFVNTYYTNIVTNNISITNWLPEFKGIQNSGGEETASMSEAELNIYYSPYLHTANTYLKLKQYKEAQIYYEVFLTNVGNNYYQFDNISKMIDELKNVEITNRLYIEKNKPLSVLVITNELDNSISTVYYSDGQQEIVDTSFENGDTSRLQRYKDGTVVNTLTYSGRSSVVETLYANGKKEIETIEPNNSIVRTSFDIDSTKRIFSTNTVSLGQYSYTEYADGNNITKISDDSKNTTLIERLDASFTKYQLLTDGTKEIYTLNPDGSELYRMEYPDGKVEVSVEYPDGSTVDRVNYADNTVRSVSKYPDGSTTLTSIDADGKMTITTTYVDGSTITRVANQSDSEGAMVLTSSTYDEYKNFITTTVDEDGSIRITTKSPDSTLKTEVVSTDGTITAEIQKPTGFVDTKTTQPDGSTTSVVNTALGTTIETLNADGSSKIETTDTEGNITTTTKNIDKSTSVDVSNIDGSYEKTILKEDGSGSIDILDKDGNSIQTTLYRNGISKSVVNKEDGVKIDVVKSNNEKNTVITFTDGTIYRISEMSGLEASLRVDIATVLEELAEDLSELETSEAIDTIKKILSSPNDHSKEQVQLNIKNSLDYSDDYMLLIENIASIKTTYTHEEEANKILLSLEEKLEQERLEQERLEQERLEQERLEQERLEQERLEQERLEQERLEQERLEQERLEQERLEQERLEQERLEQERLEQERLEQERLEQERLEQERLEQETSSREEYIKSLVEALEQIAANQLVEEEVDETSEVEDSSALRDEYILSLIEAIQNLSSEEKAAEREARMDALIEVIETLIETMKAVAGGQTTAQETVEQTSDNAHDEDNNEDSSANSSETAGEDANMEDTAAEIEE